MQKQDTASGGSPQGHQNLRTSADNTSVRREWTRRKFQFLAAAKFKLSSDSSGKTCEEHKISHHLATDIANEVASGRHDSVVAHLRTFGHCKYHGGMAL
jgi:hypothetical protein